MGISLRQNIKAKRRGIRADQKKCNWPMLMKWEFDDNIRWKHCLETNKVYIFRYRLGIHSVRKLDVRAYKRAEEQKRRMERGHRMVRRIFGPLID